MMSGFRACMVVSVSGSLPFDIKATNRGGRAGIQGEGVGTTQARRGSEPVPVIDESQRVPSLTLSRDTLDRGYVGTLTRMSIDMRVVACCWPGVHPY